MPTDYMTVSGLTALVLVAPHITERVAIRVATTILVFAFAMRAWGFFHG